MIIAGGSVFYYNFTDKKLEKMIVSGGRLGVQIELKPEDLKKASRGEFADIIFKQPE